jgi:hypothetical protein
MSIDKSKPTAADVPYFPGLPCFFCTQEITAQQGGAAVPIHGGEPDDNGFMDIVAWAHGGCAEDHQDETDEFLRSNSYDDDFYREMSDAYAEAMGYI